MFLRKHIALEKFGKFLDVGGLAQSALAIDPNFDRRAERGPEILVLAWMKTRVSLQVVNREPAVVERAGKIGGAEDAAQRTLEIRSDPKKNGLAVGGGILSEELVVG